MNPCCVVGGCVRYLWMLVNIIVIGGGALLIAFGGKYFSSTVTDFFGRSYFIAYVTLGGALIVVGCLGFLATCTANGCLLSMYSLVCNLVMVPVLAIGILCVLFSAKILTAGWLNDQLENGWTSAVKSHPSAVCQYQVDHLCSGYTSNCRTANQKGECPSSCIVGNAFPLTCKDAYTTDLQTIARNGGIIAIIFGIVLVAGSLVSCVMCCCPGRLTPKYKKYKDDSSEDV
mmetsp:Transcript_37158/g.60175  ORF Transcript_37158/g.60175 Transcript_37158/m.60175 type:complete len:230 (-) Transcript_37158:326-1015(-)